MGRNIPFYEVIVGQIPATVALWKESSVTGEKVE